MSKRFQWLSAAARRTEWMFRSLTRARRAKGPRLTSGREPFDPHAHALRGCYLGLLTATGGFAR